MHHRLEYVRCGKARCRSCPHGPYWYSYTWEGKRLRKRYVGKRWRGVDARQFALRAALDAERRLDAVFDRRTISTGLCLEILGLDHLPTLAELKRRYNALARRYHPDAGGAERMFQRINAANSWLRSKVVT